MHIAWGCITEVSLLRTQFRVSCYSYLLSNYLNNAKLKNKSRKDGKEYNPWCTWTLLENKPLNGTELFAERDEQSTVDSLQFVLL